MKYTSFFSALLVASSVAVAATAANPAAAISITSYTFENIFPSGGNTSGDALKKFFSLDVSNPGSNQVLFQFRNALNNTATTSFISQVALNFNANNLLSNPTLNINNIGIVNFQPDGQNLPQKNNIPNWDNNATTFGGERIVGSGNANGVQPGETLGFQFNGGYNTVIAALNNGGLRVGIHVQGLPGNASDSYYAKPVPEPITMFGLGVGVVGGGLLKQKYGKKANKEKVTS